MNLDCVNINVARECTNISPFIIPFLAPVRESSLAICIYMNYQLNRPSVSDQANTVKTNVNGRTSRFPQKIPNTNTHTTTPTYTLLKQKYLNTYIIHNLYDKCLLFSFFVSFYALTFHFPITNNQPTNQNAHLTNTRTPQL